MQKTKNSYVQEWFLRILDFHSIEAGETQVDYIKSELSVRNQFG